LFWYNVARAYSKKGYKDKAIRYLGNAISINKEYKGKAKADGDFKMLWGIEDFNRLIR